MLIKDLANGYYVLAIDFLHIDQFPPRVSSGYTGTDIKKQISRS